MKLQIPDYQQARVLIVGDVMLDRYWHGSTSRISPEAPVPIVHIKQEEERPGGAGNVALNIAALGSHVSLLGFTGDDIAATMLENKLTAANVACHFCKTPGLPTVTKLRILSQHQQLIRLDFEEPNVQHNIPQQIHSTYQAELAKANIVVLSDYAKGALRCAPELIQLATAAGIPVLVDPKGTDFTIYRGATLLTPN